ncbi:hypothetical protein [Herbidospora cretacea]|uniref:hypothetical protein n=1 Tax=Herbidospora cretacea TaxID=28444 RepID=UPI000773CA48|nr:hypothetical protein [Herbidospora cretacea]
MANTLYDKGREKFLTGALSWSSDNIKVYLVRGYTPNTSTHEFVSDVTGGGGGTIVATSANLSSKTTTAGVADAADETYSSVSAGASCAHLVIAKDTGSAATSPLIGYIDTGTGLPVTPNGADIAIVWDSGSNKIFKL